MGPGPWRRSRSQRHSLGFQRRRGSRCNAWHRAWRRCAIYPAGGCHTAAASQLDPAIDLPRLIHFLSYSERYGAHLAGYVRRRTLGGTGSRQRRRRWQLFPTAFAILRRCSLCGLCALTDSRLQPVRGLKRFLGRGKQSTEPPPCTPPRLRSHAAGRYAAPLPDDLEAQLAHASPAAPLLLLLSPGADPLPAVAACATRASFRQNELGGEIGGQLGIGEGEMGASGGTSLHVVSLLQPDAEAAAERALNATHVAKS